MKYYIKVIKIIKYIIQKNIKLMHTPSKPSKGRPSFPKSLDTCIRGRLMRPESLSSSIRRSLHNQVPTAIMSSRSSREAADPQGSPSEAAAHLSEKFLGHVLKSRTKSPLRFC